MLARARKNSTQKPARGAAPEERGHQHDQRYVEGKASARLVPVHRQRLVAIRKNGRQDEEERGAEAREGSEPLHRGRWARVSKGKGALRRASRGSAITGEGGERVCKDSKTPGAVAMSCTAIVEGHDSKGEEVEKNGFGNTVGQCPPQDAIHKLRLGRDDAKARPGILAHPWARVAHLTGHRIFFRRNFNEAKRLSLHA